MTSPTPTPPCLGEREAVARTLGAPHCWVIPGQDTASDYGTIDAHCIEHGEMSRPLWPIENIMAAVATLRTENETLRARAEAAEKVLVGQTPDGSEYHTKDADGYRVDVQRCARFITEDRASKHDLIRKTILAKNAAEAERDAAIARTEEAEAKTRERAAKVCDEAASYFDRTNGHYDRSQAARSYRHSASEIRRLSSLRPALTTPEHPKP